jgi:hypothetical protein
MEMEMGTARMERLGDGRAVGCGLAGLGLTV